MYTKHFGLEMMPFENVPDPKFFFNESEHARVRRRISGSLKTGKGLIVVTGPIGSGKTTLSQIIISNLSDDTKLIWMAEPPKHGIDLFLFIAEELGLQPASRERVFVLRDIRNALMTLTNEDRECILIIDESHLMSDDVIDSIRILNNLEETSSKLIKILLLGQIEIMETINRPEMEPFRQRITTLENLGRMSSDRIRDYILHRIKVAGGEPSIFTDTAMDALVLAAGTGGSIPRVTNLLCDRSLNEAFERKDTTVIIDDVYRTAGKMKIDKEIFHYKIKLRTEKRNGKVAESEENYSVEKTDADKETYHELTENSNVTESGKDKKHPESSPSIHEESGNGSANEGNHKGFKNYCTEFLNRVLSRGEIEPSEKEETSVSPENGEGEIQKVTDNPDIDEKILHGNNETLVEYDKPAATDQKEPEKSVDSDAEGNVTCKEKTDSSGWVSMSTTGAKSMETGDDKVKGLQKKEGADSASEWIRTDSEGTKSVRPVDIYKKEK